MNPKDPVQINHGVRMGWASIGEAIQQAGVGIVLRDLCAMPFGEAVDQLAHHGIRFIYPFGESAQPDEPRPHQHETNDIGLNNQKDAAELVDPHDPRLRDGRAGGTIEWFPAKPQLPQDGQTVMFADRKWVVRYAPKGLSASQSVEFMRQPDHLYITQDRDVLRFSQIDEELHGRSVLMEPIVLMRTPNTVGLLPSGTKFRFLNDMMSRRPGTDTIDKEIHFALVPTK